MDSFPFKNKETEIEKLHLKEALDTLMKDKIPNSDQQQAIAAYVDRFVTCSLRNPATSEIAKQVNTHHHTKTCKKRNTKCRFNFPRFPSLRTILAVPLRHKYSGDEKNKINKKIRTVLSKIKNILDCESTMKEFAEIGKNKLNELLKQNKAPWKVWK